MCSRLLNPGLNGQGSLQLLEPAQPRLSGASEIASMLTPLPVLQIFVDDGFSSAPRDGCGGVGVGDLVEACGLARVWLRRLLLEWRVCGALVSVSGLI